MLKKRVIDSLSAIFARISAYSPLTKAIFIIIFVSIAISVGYGIQTLTHRGQIAEITDVPATPPIIPPLINWQTPSVTLVADKIEITTNTQGEGYLDKVFLADPAVITNFTLHSDPPDGDGNHTTLEATWTENSVEMRLYMYFEAYLEGSVRIWRLTRVNTYNGNNPGDWVDSYSGGTELFTPTLMGSSLNIPYVELSTSGGGYFHVKFTNLRLQAFLSETTPLCERRTPSISLSLGNQNGLPGQILTYEVAITNTDSETCGPSNFGFGTMTDYPFTADPSIFSNYIPAGGTFHTSFIAVSPATNPWNEQRSVPVSFAATNFASGLNSSITGYYTLLMPSPQTFDMYFKLAGVTGGGADGTKVNVKFYLKDGTVRALSEPLTLSYGSDGVYHTSVTISNPFSAGTQFRLKVKGEKHIAIEFCKASGQTGPCGDNDYIVIPANQQSSYMLSLVGIPLPPGDLSPQDGRANIEDLNKLKPLMGKLQSALTDADLLIGDVNYDNFINIYDVFLILKTVETRYDD